MLFAADCETHNIVADSSHYASTPRGAPARKPHPDASILRSRSPSRSPHLQIESENRSCSLAAEQACEKWTLTPSKLGHSKNSLFAQTNSLILENKFPVFFRRRVGRK